MTLKQYLVAMSLGTVAALAILLWAIWNINPQTTGFFGLAIFYISLFLSGLGLFSTIELVGRVWLIKQAELPFRQAQKSFRHGLLFALLLVLALVLQSQRYLKWWATLGLVVVFTFTEILLSAGQKKRF